MVVEAVPGSLEVFARVFERLGYRYPQDAYSAPAGIEVYSFREFVTVRPAREPDDTDFTGDSTIKEAGVRTQGNRLMAPPNGIVIVQSIYPTPLNRTAVENSSIEYEGVAGDVGGLFCAPGVGSSVRNGTTFGISNVIIFPRAEMRILMWNQNPCSQAKWTLYWRVYTLLQT